MWSTFFTAVETQLFQWLIWSRHASSIECTLCRNTPRPKFEETFKTNIDYSVWNTRTLLLKLMLTPVILLSVLGGYLLELLPRKACDVLTFGLLFGISITDSGADSWSWYTLVLF